MNLNYLKGKIVEKGYNQQSLSKKIKIPYQTLNLKINGKKLFNLLEMQKIQAVLDLSADDIKKIFFN